MRSDLKERKERMAPSFQWWANESHRGTLVVVKMENLNWSMVELEGPTEDNFLITTDSPGSGRTRDKGHRGRKNAKQLTWVLMLKAHRVAGCLTSIASALFGLATLIHRHLASGRIDFDEIENENEHENDALVEGMGREKENLAMKTRFYFCTKMFLWVSVILIGFGFFFFFFTDFSFFFLKIPKFIKKKNQNDVVLAQLMATPN